MTYKPVIGLEVHVELKTKSKMFCGCSADYFGQEPNTHTCPVCLGLPGALPVPNKEAIEWCLKIGLALGCKVNNFSKFDRKNYFYPDLAKGYQISQYDIPFSEKGEIELKNKRKIGITRIHMEEDTGKLIHNAKDDSTLIDFNRSGVPLVEIVTEPDFESASEVVEYLKKLQQIVKYLGVANAEMEKGEMRLEPNISLRVIDTSGLPKYRVEVKNINSFRFVEKSINFEIKRQTEILEAGETPTQETRGWNEVKQKTVSQRQKEEANDYRYFPEPDIPPFTFSDDYVNKLKSNLPELGDGKVIRFQKEYALSYYDAEILCREKEIADFFEKAVELAKKDEIQPKQIANFLINRKIDISLTEPDAIIEEILVGKTVVIDEKELDKVVDEVIMSNTKAVEDLKSGKEQSMMFLMGQVLRTIGKKIDTNLVKEKINQKIK
jgi:aspartyl-tRNA(Asn)/glutamyl-tRNA(Gln) amidotransferase subunit B